MVPQDSLCRVAGYELSCKSGGPRELCLYQRSGMWIASSHVSLVVASLQARIVALWMCMCRPLLHC